LNHFPAYNAVVLYRADLVARVPAAVALLSRIEGAIDATRMAAMNAAVKLERRPDAEVAAAFVSGRLGVAATADADGFPARLWRTTLDHLGLVAISLGAAILIAVPLGIVAARRPATGQAILAAVGILQTIPSLALFVFMIPLLGIGGPPAIVALFLYSLLPIVRNTHAGLVGIDSTVTESAAAMGLPPSARLRLVELPLAMRQVMAGIKTSAVINVGTATLGALIGAGGYGQPILTGIRLDDIGLILEGAVPAAVLALAVQGLFELGERAVVPRGLRIPSAS
jgi:osmoprotectant transport system permease protein